VILALALIGYWIQGAIREESDEVRASIAKAANDIPFAKLGKEIERQLDDVKILAEKAAETARRDPGDAMDANDLLGEVLRTGQRMSSRVDDIGQEVFRLRPDEVEALGVKLNAEIGRQARFVGDEKTVERMRRLAKPFLADVRQSAKAIRFHVVDDEQVNAFAHIGGHVYVTTGLLGFVQSDEELQFVIGHEIAHVKLGHCAAAMTYSAQAAKLAGDAGERLTQLAYHAIAVGYSEDHEFAADALSCRQAPVCRAAAVAFLERLRRIYPDAASSTDGDSAGAPPAADLLRELDNHFRTHPDTKARVERLSSRR